MLKLGVPSKGRLMQGTFDWFAARGVTLHKTGRDREYRGLVEGVEGVELVLMTASEIPQGLAEGQIHLGVVGSDLVHESLPMHEQQVSELVAMGFGRADLVLAVPDFWVDVTTLHDLDAVAAKFRADHGFRLRIATKYHRLVRGYLKHHGIADYQLVDSQGATEGAVKNENAEAIADITSTGATLRDNHLRILDAPVIHASQARLYRSCTVQFGAGETAALEAIGAIIHEA